MTIYSLNATGKPTICNYCKKDCAGYDYFDVGNFESAICHPCLMLSEAIK